MNRAFSLVELSIVLVILGLLTGGILTGQSLIRAAELRAVTTEFQNYQTAVMTFRDKYFALPGDMRNAEDFWGSMTNCDAASTSGTGTQTCNGNGNGWINSAPADQNSEYFTFWQQLANAGLIEGSYTGIVGSGGAEHAVIDVNVPRSKMSNGGWTIKSNNASYFAGNSFVPEGIYGNHMFFGAATTTTHTSNAILTPEELWNIDTKIDDGQPAYGTVIAMSWGTTVADNKCSINAADETDLDADYNLTYSSVVCTIIFRDIF